MWPFSKKDKNLLNNQFISDHLIKMTRNLLGEDREKLLSLVGTNFHEESNGEGMSAIYAPLNNGCISAATMENNVIFKFNIILNAKPNYQDIENCKLFESTHSEKYYFFSIFDKNAKKHIIGFESKQV